MFDVGLWTKAVREVETGALAWNSAGDHDRALGPFQFHPAAFWEWAPQPHLGETWPAWFTEAAEAFASAWLAQYPDGDPVECAVVFHRHCYIRRALSLDYSADNYSARFKAAWDKLQP